MFMKKLTFIFCLLLACAGLHSRTLSDKGAFRQWQDNKYSMFIHFGLYTTVLLSFLNSGRLSTYL